MSIRLINLKKVDEMAIKCGFLTIQVYFPQNCMNLLEDEFPRNYSFASAIFAECLSVFGDQLWMEHLQMWCFVQLFLLIVREWLNTENLWTGYL